MDRSPVPTLDEDVFKGDNFRTLIDHLVDSPMEKKAMADGYVKMRLPQKTRDEAGSFSIEETHQIEAAEHEIKFLPFDDTGKMGGSFMVQPKRKEEMTYGDYENTTAKHAFESRDSVGLVMEFGSRLKAAEKRDSSFHYSIQDEDLTEARFLVIKSSLQDAVARGDFSRGENFPGITSPFVY